MTTHVPARQPFAALDNPRLHSLASIKNRQNAISRSVSSPVKPTVLSSPVKRRYEPAFEDEPDTENLDPSIFSSPSKRSKNVDGTPMKKPAFVLNTKAQSTFTFSTPSSITPASAPPTKSSVSSPPAKITPISASRGSPKHKRAGLLSKRRHASSSPFTRVNPPKFSRSSRLSDGCLPFSIDAALSGTISSYTPKSIDIAPSEPCTASPLPATEVATIEESMPKSWFFDIHEDTPEEDAANMMEHSTCVLDISSDDDGIAKRDAERRERGKENIPPPDWVAGNGLQAAAPSTEAVAHVPAVQQQVEVVQQRPVKSAKFRREKLAPGLDAMEEDVLRSPLGDLEAKDFYPAGLDETSVVTVDAEAAAAAATEVADAATDAPSKATFDFVAPPVEDDAATEVEVEVEAEIQTAAPTEAENASEDFVIWEAEKMDGGCAGAPTAEQDVASAENAAEGAGVPADAM